MNSEEGEYSEEDHVGTKINYRGRGLEEVPDDVLQQIHTSRAAFVILAQNRLTTFPLFDSLNRIGTLNLSDNRLTEVPLAVGRMTNLCTLYLTKNRITHIPNFIRELKKLQFLYVSNNRITEFPTCFKENKNLVSLHLEENQIESLDLDTVPCRLEILGLTDNKIKNVWVDREQIDRLYPRLKLELLGNPIEPPFEQYKRMRWTDVQELI